MNTSNNENTLLSLGRWTQEGLDHFMQESSNIHDTGERIEFISREFLGVVYKESTLIGDINRDEVFVINLEGIDCMTFIEYIEAMRLSGSFSEFLENLKRVRYSQGKVAFESRNHFFTDWIESNSEFIEDMTDRVGGAKAAAVKKRLNLKPVPEEPAPYLIRGFNRGKDGGYILPGIPSKEREIKYIPADAVGDAVLDKLKTGDYVGMYSKDDGLDVSHVGIIIRDKGNIFLRHASSVIGKVVDEDLKNYIAKKEGLIVMRPRLRMLEQGFWFPRLTRLLSAIYRYLPGTIFNRWLNDVAGASELYQFIMLLIAVVWLSFVQMPLHPVFATAPFAMIGIFLAVIRPSEILLFSLHWVFVANDPLFSVRRSLACFFLNLLEIAFFFAIMSQLASCSLIPSSPWSVVYGNLAAIFKLELVPRPPGASWCSFLAHYQVIVAGVILPITIASLVGGVLRSEKKD